MSISSACFCSNCRGCCCPTMMSISCAGRQNQPKHHEHQCASFRTDRDRIRPNKEIQREHHEHQLRELLSSKRLFASSGEGYQNRQQQLWIMCQTSCKAARVGRKHSEDRFSKVRRTIKHGSSKNSSKIEYDQGTIKNRAKYCYSLESEDCSLSPSLFFFCSKN